MQFRNTILKLICLHVIVIAIQSVHAQDLSSQFNLYTKKNGLSYTRISAITQDAFGFLWIGTMNGLNRFDGKNFKTFYQNNSSGPADNNIFNIINLGNHELGIATINGASIFNTKTYSFKSLNFYADLSIRYWAYAIRDIAKDKFGNYALSTGSGLYIFSKDGKLKNSYQPYKNEDIIRGKRFGSHFFHLHDSSLILLSRNRDYIFYNNNTNQFENAADRHDVVRLFKSNNAFFIRKLSRNAYFFLSENGLKYNIYNVLSGDIFNAKIPANIQNKIDWYAEPIQITDSSWLFNSSNNLYRLTRLPGKNVTYIFDTIYNLNFQAYRFLKDQSGRLWVGNATGLYRQNSPNYVVNNYPVTLKSNIEKISALAIKNDIIYAATTDMKILQIKKENFTVGRRFNIKSAHNQNITINDMMLYAKDTLWLSTNIGILWLNTNNGNKGELKNLAHNGHLLGGAYINHIYKDSEGDYWFSSYREDKLLKYNNRKKQVEYIDLKNREISYPTNISEDKNKNIWISADIAYRWSKHLNKIDSQLSYLPLQHNYAKGYTILFNQNNDAWIHAKDDGWIIYQDKKKQQRLDNPQSIIYTNYIPTIINNKIYSLNYNNEITIINTEDKTLNFLNESDGKPELMVTTPRFFYDSTEKKIWFASNNIISSIPETLTNFRNTTYPFLISAINISKLGNIYYPTHNLQLEHYQNSINIQLNSINFNDGENTTYRYKILNNDTDWINLPGNEILLNSLSPGNYHFVMQAISKTGKWKSAEKHVQITIRPAFWETWWFALLLILSAVAIAYNYIRQYLSSLKKKQIITNLENEKHLAATEALLKGQEDERERLARDLHDGLGGMLSGIKMTITNIKDQQNNGDAKFDKPLSQLDTTISELRKISHNLMPDVLLKYGLVTALKEFCNTISQTGYVEVVFQYIGQPRHLEHTENLYIYRIIQELVNNSIKHGKAKNILTQLTLHPSKILITVDDDGYGFNTNQVSTNTGMGIRSIQQRLNYLKGEMDIESKPGGGTSVNIELNI